MKKIKYIWFLLLSVCLLPACEEPQYQEVEEMYETPLLNFVVKKVGESSEYRSLQKGPFYDGDTLYIDIPTTEEDPVDLSRLNCFASLANDAKIVPGIPGEMNFSDVVSLNVLDWNGKPYTYYIKVIPVLPKTVFKDLWFKNAIDLEILRTNISGMAAYEDNLYVADFNVWDMADPTGGVKVYDRSTGQLQKIIPAPTTFTHKVCVDEAGHIIVNRYNIYGAGFILYFYETEDSAPLEILNYTAPAGCPDYLGENVNVIGNLKNGKAYVYATTGGSDTFYFWEFNDGVPTNVIPQTIKYASAGGAWAFANMQRASIAATSDHYLTFFSSDGVDEAREQGSRFDILTSGFDIKRMNPANHDYKILDFKVFSMHGDRFLAILQQGFWAWDAFSIKVFEITDEGNLELEPGDEGYENFSIYTSDIYGGLNYNKWGDIDVYIEGNEAFVYATFASWYSESAGVWACKMKYNPR